MEYLIVCLAALLVSGLTLFSGFGLGTVLMPVFALFFPIPVAIAATALVHLANNIFKVFLVGREADWDVVARFAAPGAIAALLGAALLSFFTSMPTLYAYQIGGQMHEITVVKAVIGTLIVVFSFLELLPRFRKMAFDRRHLPLGGLVSGFFGGLSGNQGALRSAFLIKAGLGKEAFIGTGTVSAVIVDAARMIVYGLSFYATKFADLHGIWGLVLAATLAAFVGSFMGAQLLKKITLDAIQVIVGILLVILGTGIAVGLL